MDGDLMQLDSSPQSPSNTPQSSVQQAYLSSDAFYFCMTQCLSTEVEEVMGLLIGELDENNGHCRITHCLPLKRLDKRKDRVEIGTEQLASAFSVVEELTAMKTQQRQETGDTRTVQLQVVGWYHSHPHITVFPSEVDIATHHQYQSTMSPFWLGLIFGVFNYEDNTATNRFQLIAFQSSEDSGIGSAVGKSFGSGSANGRASGRRSLKHVVVPIEVQPRESPSYDQWTLRKMASIIDLLLEEENEAFNNNQAEGQPGGATGKYYNACVYSKAVAKVIALLGAPLMDVSKDQFELAARLKGTI